MIKVLFIFIITLLLTSSACAFQFEDNKWGSPFEGVYDTLKAGKHDIERGEYYIKYEDAIFGKSCYVKFFFTPQTKLLAKILIEWKENDIGVQIKKEIIKKYGPPNKGDNMLTQFFWEEGRSAEDERMVFSYGPALPATLNYYGGIYWRKFQEEGGKLFRPIPFL